MKAVMLSLRPQWCEKIFNGSKSIEIRKSRPSIPTPFKVYVYQTKIKFKVKNWQENFQSIVFTPNGGVEEGNGKVIGSFVCDRVEEYEGEFWDDDTYERIQEPWEPSDFAEYGEYEYDTIGENGEFYGKGIELSKQSCLSWNELRKYVGQGLKDFYGWHIIEPKLFDKPRELGEFSKFGYKYLGGCCVNYNCPNCIDNGWMQPPECKIDGCFLTRPPQSWCYIETNEN